MLLRAKLRLVMVGGRLGVRAWVDLGIAFGFIAACGGK